MKVIANDDPSIPLYTQEEKHWLKKHFDGEFKFLRDYGLSIYKDEDREEGRQLLRALMEGDLDNETSTRSEKARVDGDDEPEEENRFLRELEMHPESHFADHHFSEDELEWIEKHYDYSSNFLMSFGLKFYDDEDCQEGKLIVQQFMREDD
ncbi:MAG: hypothetical protein OHK93_007300 [Ramalina farinacea]|uniref:Uncharacterized protein n=1 Tax=Ramalina farinacea TaxID=258253 RepID=A0AA43TQU9_9LECA|nr:hypothetical protein [Ramalina farinacea]